MSIILTILINNIIIEKRKEQILILKDRGGLNWQVLVIFLIELIILNIISILLAIFSSFLISASIPSIASGTFSGQVFTEFIVNANFPFTLTLYLSICVFLITCTFSMVKLILLMKNNIEERQRLQR